MLGLIKTFGLDKPQCNKNDELDIVDISLGKVYDTCSIEDANNNISYYLQQNKSAIMQTSEGIKPKAEPIDRILPSKNTILYPDMRVSQLYEDA